MIKKVDFNIKELEHMKKYPKELYYVGDTQLLFRPKVAIVGSRKPIQYTRSYTFDIAQKLSNQGATIVSGAAMGVDAIAHNGADFNNTIAVLPNSLDIFYPAINKKMITYIQERGLCLSQYSQGIKPTNYSFVLRNEIVVALGDILIITQADKKSGSMRSAEYALDMGKDIYVLPHRNQDSDGTNYLLEKGFARPIYDVDLFIKSIKLDIKVKAFSNATNKACELIDPLLEECKHKPTYDELVSKYGEKVFEYELLGKININNGIVTVA